MGESGNDDDLPTELLYNNVKDKLPAQDINTEAIASDLRITKTEKIQSTWTKLQSSKFSKLLLS